MDPIKNAKDFPPNHGRKGAGGNVLISDGHAEWQDVKVWTASTGRIHLTRRTTCNYRSVA